MSTPTPWVSVRKAGAPGTASGVMASGGAVVSGGNNSSSETSPTTGKRDSSGSEARGDATSIDEKTTVISASQHIIENVVGSGMKRGTGSRIGSVRVESSSREAVGDAASEDKATAGTGSAPSTPGWTRVVRSSQRDMAPVRRDEDPFAAERDSSAPASPSPLGAVEGQSSPSLDSSLNTPPSPKPFLGSGSGSGLWKLSKPSAQNTSTGSLFLLAHASTSSNALEGVAVAAASKETSTPPASSVPTSTTSTPPVGGTPTQVSPPTTNPPSPTPGSTKITPVVSPNSSSSNLPSASSLAKDENKFDMDRWEAIQRKAAELKSRLVDEASQPTSQPSGNQGQAASSSSTTATPALSTVSSPSSTLDDLEASSLARLPQSSSLHSGGPADVRIVVGGVEQSGKTSILLALSSAEPSGGPDEPQVYRKSFAVGSTSHTTDLTDLPQKQFNDDATFRFYSQKADAFVLFYSVSEPKTYDKVKKMVKRISEFQVKKVPVLLFGNSSGEYRVQLADVQAYASKWAPALIITAAEGSVKEISAAETAFLGLVKTVADTKQKRADFQCMLADKTLVMKVGEGKDFKADHIYLRVWLTDGLGTPREYNGQKVQSKVLDKSGNVPVWNETLEYNLKGVDFTQYEGVLVEVYNKAAIGKDDFLGQLIWDWRELENLLGTKSFFQIKSKPSKGGEPKVMGTVGIGIAVKRTRA